MHKVLKLRKNADFKLKQAYLNFIGLCIWAWSSRRKADFEASAALPLEEDQIMTNGGKESGR